MSSLLDAARTEASARGIIDPDVVRVLDFSRVRVVDGEANEEDVRDVVAQAIRNKPHLFKDAAALGDAAFAALEQRLRERGPSANNGPPAYAKAINSLELDAEEDRALRTVLIGSASTWDLGVVERVARKQGLLEASR